MKNQVHILTKVEKLIMKILNLELAILLENQKKKTFLQKAMFQIGLNKFLWLKLCRGHMLLVVLKTKEFLKCFMTKNCTKNQKEFRVEKVIKRKYSKLYVKWKGYDSSFNSWIDKKDKV